jgi:predicted RNase H-like HicB family nuclease
VKYKVVLEYDPETRHYSAIVPGLPGLFVDAKSEREALEFAKEGIVFYLKELATARPRAGSKSASPETSGHR